MVDQPHSVLIVIDSSFGHDPAEVLAATKESGRKIVTSPPEKAAQVAGIARLDAVVLVCGADAEGGCSLCGELARQGPLAELPLVAVVANATDDTLRQTLASGCVDMIRWPDQAAELSPRLGSHIRTHRKNLEARARSEAMRGVLFDAVLEVDENGAVAAIDPGTIESLEAGARRVAKGEATSLEDLLPGTLLGPMGSALERASDAGHCQLAPCRLSETADSPWLELSVIRQGDGGPGARFLVLARDVTERLVTEDNRMFLERKLHRDEKMASLARLARGVSNDMRNVLGAILSFATSVREDLGEDSLCRDVLERITDACWRGADLASELATLSGESDMDKSRVSVNDAVREVVDLLSQAIPAGTSVRTELAEGSADILGVPTRISQVLTYLALHAVDAMKAGGVLTVVTEERDLTAAELEQHPDLGPGKYVVLAVSDTGEGMDPATAAHAFEPFYSSKSSDEGSGLELPMVYGVVRAHHGELTLDSELGRGTKVTIFLPAFEAEDRRRRHESPDIGKLDFAAGRILVVDDEELIRESCSRLLGRLGHEVIVARSGADALEIYREHGRDISLVILDLAMPGLSGAETLDKLLALDADARVLVSSGYAGENEVQDLLARGAIGFLPKPFGFEGLKRGLAMAAGGGDGSGAGE